MVPFFPFSFANYFLRFVMARFLLVVVTLPIGLLAASKSTYCRTCLTWNSVRTFNRFSELEMATASLLSVVGS